MIVPLFYLQDQDKHRLILSWPYHNIKLLLLYQQNVIKFANFILEEKVRKKYNAFFIATFMEGAIEQCYIAHNLISFFMSYHGISLMIEFLLGYKTRVASIPNL